MAEKKLKIKRSSLRAGSSPAFGTIEISRLPSILLGSLFVIRFIFDIIFDIIHKIPFWS